MIIIPAMDVATLPRLVSSSLADRLRAMPAVVVTGARQTGKSTLAQDLAPGRRRYFTLDDLDVVDTARRDPEALVGGDRPVTLDDVQREPDLLSAVKRAIDGKRRPGQCLLTGSANLLPMRQVSESLAGRASHLTLWPMTRREQAGSGRCRLWEELLATPDEDWLDVLAAQPEVAEDWRALARRGGFPTPALELRSANERAIWFDGYVRTYLERDLQALSSIAALPDFRRLMRAVCLRLGQLVNQTELGRDVALAQPTVHRWLNLLETSYLLVRLPAYAVNRTKRLIKSPKACWCDTGVAPHLGEGEPRGGPPREPGAAGSPRLARCAPRPRRAVLLAHGGRRGGGLRDRGGPAAPSDRGQDDGAPASWRCRAPAELSRRVREEGSRRAPAAHRQHAGMAGAGRAGRTVVEGAVRRSTSRRDPC